MGDHALRVRLRTIGDALMTVMIISSFEDPHAHAVMRALKSRSVEIELLDLAEYPTRLALSMAFANGARRLVLSRFGGGQLDLETITAVWWRRPQPFRLPNATKDPVHRRFALSEAGTAFSGLYRAMDVLWVNDPVRDEAAHHKPWQLDLAQKIGLAIPETLMTSDPAEALDFWRQNGGNVIYKQFRALPDAWRETRRMRQEELAFAENIRVTPVIFQRFVEAVADLRVTIIGEEIFAAAADPRGGEYPVDFRFNMNLKWQPHQLPSSVEDLLRLLMRKLGLEYGAIDLRLTPEGQYVFLEINPAGQFLWIELETGQRISEALAAHLTRAAPTPAAELTPLALSHGDHRS
jgi:glutathione synthase/RimK-type ligase-like ATP-grasp enzyme